MIHLADVRFQLASESKYNASDRSDSSDSGVFIFFPPASCTPAQTCRRWTSQNGDYREETDGVSIPTSINM